MTTETSPDPIRLWVEHWQDESDAAYLYRALSDSEPDPARKALFLELSEVEGKHVELWTKLLASRGRVVPAGGARPSVRARAFAWIGRKFGPRWLLPRLLAEEGREVKGYLKMSRTTVPGEAREAALRLARESSEHAGTLAGLAGRGGEPWHRTGSGGFVRNVVYGFNDGLTANFGLVAGVIGASVEPRIVLLSGLAGMIADALSMGSSGYLAAKSEREVWGHEIAMEKEEIRVMPEVEEMELALIYEARGFAPERARALAREVMADGGRGLEEKVREELRISPGDATPLQEGAVTGTATAIGALIPVVPFFVLSGAPAMWVSFTLAMACHFAVGAARSFFTGRSVVRSGIDMFLVGIGVAAVGYMVGDLLAPKF